MAGESEQGIDLAMRYAREIADLADRMEADGDRLHNRGRWNDAVWLLRKDVRDKLASFIGERVMATGGAGREAGPPPPMGPDEI